MHVEPVDFNVLSGPSQRLVHGVLNHLPQGVVAEHDVPDIAERQRQQGRGAQNRIAHKANPFVRPEALALRTVALQFQLNRADRQALAGEHRRRTRYEAAFDRDGRARRIGGGFGMGGANQNSVAVGAQVGVHRHNAIAANADFTRRITPDAALPWRKMKRAERPE